jgi:hypothetical protein
MPRFSTRDIHRTLVRSTLTATLPSRISQSGALAVNTVTPSNIPADLVQPLVLGWQCVLRSFRQHLTPGQITISSLHKGKMTSAIKSHQCTLANNSSALSASGGVVVDKRRVAKLVSMQKRRLVSIKWSLYLTAVMRSFIQRLGAGIVRGEGMVGPKYFAPMASTVIALIISAVGAKRHSP